MLVPLVADTDTSPGKPAARLATRFGDASPGAHAPAREAGPGQGFEAVLAVATGLLDCRYAMLWVSEASRLRLVASRGLDAGDCAGSGLGTLVDPGTPTVVIADASSDPRLRGDLLVSGPAGLLP